MIPQSIQAAQFSSNHAVPTNQNNNKSINEKIKFIFISTIGLTAASFLIFPPNTVAFVARIIYSLGACALATLLHHLFTKVIFAPSASTPPAGNYYGAPTFSRDATAGWLSPTPSSEGSWEHVGADVERDTPLQAASNIPGVRIDHIQPGANSSRENSNRRQRAGELPSSPPSSPPRARPIEGHPITNAQLDDLQLREDGLLVMPPRGRQGAGELPNASADPFTIRPQVSDAFMNTRTRQQDAQGLPMSLLGHAEPLLSLAARQLVYQRHSLDVAAAMPALGPDGFTFPEPHRQGAGQLPSARDGSRSLTPPLNNALEGDGSQLNEVRRPKSTSPNQRPYGSPGNRSAFMQLGNFQLTTQTEPLVPGALSLLQVSAADTPPALRRQESARPAHNKNVLGAQNHTQESMAMAPPMPDDAQRSTSSDSADSSQNANQVTKKKRGRRQQSRQARQAKRASEKGSPTNPTKKD